MRRPLSSALTLVLACSAAEPVAPAPPTASAASTAPSPGWPAPRASVERHPKTTGGALEAQLVELRIDARDPSALAPPLRAALPKLAKCYERTAWIDVTLEVTRAGEPDQVSVVDPEPTGICVRDLLMNLSFDRAGAVRPGGSGRVKITAAIRVGPPLYEDALPPLARGQLLVRQLDGSCGGAAPPNCHVGIVCPAPVASPVRCPVELGLSP